MSGLQEFLAPFSHLVFSNRNLVIVALCAIAFWTAAQALMDRWRADRLDRDLAEARKGESTSSPGRRYASSAIEETPMESGGALPPVKGGRTYARNLGNALQKAGMSGPAIYSPPTPQGFSPNTNPMQPPMGQPAPAPYAAPNVPWAATPPATPWAFQPGGGRNAPAPAPFYQTQPTGQPPMNLPPQQPAAPAGFSQSPAPGSFSPPQPTPFAPPSVSGPAGAPNLPAPSYPTYGPPSIQAPAPMSPPPPMAAPLSPAQLQADAEDGARRGKPKRRRFNFNVLENLEKLEKMVQPKTSEAPSVASSAISSTAPAPAAPTALPTPPTPVSPQPLPALTPQASLTPPATEMPTLPFLFGKRPASDDAKAAEEMPVEAKPVEEKAASMPEPAPTSAAAEKPGQPTVEARHSLRSMMFGEEAVAPPVVEASEAEPAPTPDSEVESGGPAPDFDSGATDVSDAAQATAAEETPSSEASTEKSDSSWPSYPWTHSDEASSSIEAEAAATTDTHGEAEPAQTSAFGHYEPWKPDHEATAETHDEASTAEEVSAFGTQTAEEPAADAPEMPPTSDVPEGSAGTLVIIEDDQTAASYYATLFRGNGYRVEVANDGVSGVDLCTKVQPQVILLDVMMPRQNGILVLQTLRASDETKDTPVVVMSNFSEPTLIKRAIQLGALEYVIKTQVEGPALLDALPRWINREKAFAAA